MGAENISAQELNRLIVEGAPLFILDTRNESDFQDWKIEGGDIAYLNVPYFELLDGVASILDRLPEDRKLIVVCAKEGSSKLVAEHIHKEGRAVSYLQGGMKSWSEYLYPVLVHQDDELTVYQFIRVGKGCLSYLLISGKEALVIDPSRFTEVYEQAAAREGVAITHIVDSHLHADHISGGHELAQKTGAHYYLMRSEGATFHFDALEEHDHISFANVHLEVLAIKTPGHTPGSVSFLVNQRFLFSGDTVFVSGLGRPDLGGKAREWALDLYHTVYEKLAGLADDIVVLPSHYADFETEKNEQGYIGTTLGHIRAMNEIMREKTVHEFVDTVAQSASTQPPPNFEDIIAINRGVRAASPEEVQELEIGPNRCAAHHT